MKNLINKTLIIILGSSIIMFLLWNRLIRERFPKVLDDFMPDKFPFFFLIFIIIFYLIMLIQALKKIFKIELNPNSLINKCLQQLLELNLIKHFYSLLKTYILESPQYLHEFIASRINLANIIELPISYLLVWFIGKKKHIIYIITNTIPKIILASTFFVDIYYFHVLSHFYKLLFLFIVPLITNYFFYSATKLADWQTYFFSAHLVFTESDDKSFNTVAFVKETPDIIGAWDIHTSSLQAAVEYFDLYMEIKSFLNKIEIAANDIKPWENLYLYSCYFLGWFYIFLHIFF